MDSDDNARRDQVVFNAEAVSILQLLIESGVKPESTESPSNVASVKFMLTAQDESGLRALGYSQELIDKMKPQEAADILQSGQKAEMV